MAAARASLHLGPLLLLLLLSIVVPSRGQEDTYQGIGPCNSMYNKRCAPPNIRFFLYTRFNSAEGEQVTVESIGNKTASSFDPRLPTKIIIHGYNSNKDLVYLVDIRKAYLSTGPHNVIAVDWSNYSNGPWFCYATVADNANHAARCVALLVEAARTDGAEDVHLIGFSVGAHLAGLTANHLSGFQIPRITGLDPAMPLFATRGPYERLDPSDASFVDVVHTNALVQGMVQECGHLDFYVNGGLLQPGCGADLGCNHHRAPAYFAESVTSSQGFWGWRCPSLFHYALGLCSPKPPAALMGANATHNSRGFHVVKTAARSPYAMGKWTTS